MAERHPRDLDIVRARLLKECKRPGFAAVAKYLKPIGRGVEGPSIRFAETAIRVMGNISVDQIMVYDDREKRITRVMVVDCETNTPYSSDVTVEKTVERSKARDGDEVVRVRKNSKGNLVYSITATEDDLLNKQNAMVSKAIRNNGLRLIPGDLVEECMDMVNETQRTTDAQDPERAKRKMFDAFQADLGIPITDIKSFLGHNAENLTEQEMMGLRQLYTALKEGHTTWREVMEMRKPVEPEPESGPQNQQAGTAGLKTDMKSKSEQKRKAAQKGLPYPEGGLIGPEGDDAA